MSKAFTRESDDLPEPSAQFRKPAPLPPGVKNYMTPDGAERLRAALERFAGEERPRWAAASDSPERAQMLRQVDEQMRSLAQCLASAVVVPPPENPQGPIRFGATVVVREERGDECSYRIVGVDEADIDRGWISWISPLAKALLNAREGDRVELRAPSGRRTLEIRKVTYS